jgi:hypothetical protein
MAARKANGGAHKPKLVRKSLMVDAAKLDQARKALGVTSDAEALRLALDHLLSHFEGGGHGEEE